MKASFLRKLARDYGTPLYVYDCEVIRRRFFLLSGAIPYSKKRIYYAAKANGNPYILRILEGCGACLDAVSPGEVFLALKAGFPPSRVVFSGNSVSDEDMIFVSRKNVIINMDSLSQIERYARLGGSGKIFLRINTLLGAGHHRRVVTGGQESKFGIHVSLVDEAKRLCKKHGLRVTGIHSHMGSGIMSKDILLRNAGRLLSLAEGFPDLDVVDFGGGLGIDYESKEPFDVCGYGKRLSEMVLNWNKKNGKEITLALEPGRFLVAESGTLVCSITDIKRNPEKAFVGTDSGFNHFMRHLLYGARHRMEVMPKRKGNLMADVCGNLCESGDVFAHDVLVGGAREGDLFIIKDAGAYGYSMASCYNARVLPSEIMVDGGRVVLARKRRKFFSLL